MVPFVAVMALICLKLVQFHMKVYGYTAY